MRAVRALLLAVALLAGTGARADCASSIDLPTRTTQGGLVLGKAAPGTTYQVSGREHRVAADGIVAFGAGRDAAPELAVQFRCEDGSEHARTLRVSPRQYRIERVDGVPPATVEPPPGIAERIAREQARVAAARERDEARSDLLQRFRQPVQGRISGVYGSQRVLNGKPKDPHYGLDIAAPTGTAVRTPAAGIVSLADNDLVLTGGTVLLDHGHGLSSVFLHLSRVDVRVGQRLKQGEVLGAVGATGRASGPHLHWGLNWFDVRLDPQLLLRTP